MKQIRICHFILGFHNGGVEKVLENYFTHMDRSKFELHIVTHMSPDPKREQIFKDMGFHIHQLSRVHGHKITLKNLKEYNDLFKNNKFDIVHNNFPENLLPLLFARIYGIKKRILHSHNDYRAAFTQNSKLQKIAYKCGLMFNAFNATEYFACGERAAETVFGKKKLKKVKVIRNAIIVEKYIFNSTRREEIRKELGLQDNLVIGHVGRYENHQKNQEFVLEIYREVLNSIPTAKLLMIGEGKLRASIMQQAKEMGIDKGVIFTGAISNVNDYFQAMDVFVFPSRHEGLGIVLVEAQAAGLYCIASEFVPKEAKVTDNVKFLPINDATKWQTEVNAHCNHIRQDMQQKIVSAGYDIVKEAAKLQEFYVQMLQRGNKRG